MKEDPPDFIVGGVLGAVAGSQKYSCTTCQSLVWLGPAAQGMVKDHPAVHILCLKCYLEKQDITEPPMMTSRAEILEICGGSEETADQLIKDATVWIEGLRKKYKRLEPWKRN